MDIRMLAAALSDPLGAPNVISIANTTSSGTNGNTSGFRFKTDGTWSKFVAGILISIGDWLSPKTNISEYEIRFTLSSGDTLSAGTLDTWMALSSQHDITLANGFVEGESFSTVLAEIRWTGNNVVQDSATLTLNAIGPFA